MIGVGLLGGSLGLALRARRQAGRVVGFVRHAESIAECRAAGAVDEATLDLRAAVADADLLVFCTPIAQMTALAKAMVPALRRGAVVTDVGSVKLPVVRALEPVCVRAGAHFVGAHPMAGSERTGVAAAQADLFVNAMCVVTPTPRTHPRARAAVERLWRGVGGRLLRLAPAAHDRLVCRTSHVPHLVAAALANRVLDSRHPPAQPRLCATGFRDTTRIASGSPEMWRDIALANRRNLVRELGLLVKDFERLRARLGAADDAAILEFLATARERREAWCAGQASPSPE